jgi:2-keto-3-deoxygluconate permease
MKILQTVKRVPGGLMVIPLVLGVLLNTFFPGFLTMKQLAGTYTNALWKTGAATLIAFFVFCNGAQINLKQAGVPLAKGVLLTISKFVIGAVLGVIVNNMFGPTGGVLGLIPLAVVGALTNSNGGLYAALAGEFGDESDVGAISILSMNDGPFLTMVAFGLTGIAEIPVLALVGAILPIIIGMILGNLDEELREFLAKGAVVTIPFFAFPLGAGLTLQNLVNAGIPGIILGVICTLFTGLGGYGVMKLIRSKRPAAGAAIGTTAGNAAATPAALALADPKLAEIAGNATVQIAAAIIVTTILCPILVNLLNGVENKRNKLKAA